MAVSHELPLLPPPCVVSPEKYCIQPCQLVERNRNAQIQAMQFFNCSAGDHQRKMVQELTSDPANRVAYLQTLAMHGITEMCDNSQKNPNTPPLPKPPIKEILM